jgi:hypothetical protein
MIRSSQIKAALLFNYLWNRDHQYGLISHTFALYSQKAEYGKSINQFPQQTESCRGFV